MNKKRWIALTIFSVLFLFYIVFQSVETLTEDFTGETEWRESIYREGGMERMALLEVDGIIADQPTDPFGAVDTYDHQLFLEQLEHAFEDQQIEGIVLQINSPGGGVVESDEIHYKLQQLREEHDKPFYVYMGNTAASGGYYISTPADQIYANQSTITGSIGVIISYLNLHELAEEWGIQEEAFTSGPYKDMMSRMKEMEDDEREILQSIVDESYDQFVSVVAEGRAMDENEVRTLADGRIYTGLQAQEVGLVDEIGYLDDAIDAAAEEAGLTNPTVVEYERTGWALDGFMPTVNNTTFDLFNENDHPSYANHPTLMYLLQW